MKQEYRDWHYRLAVYSVILSIFSLLLLALSASTIYMKTTDEWDLAQKKSLRFMETSNMIWSQMQRLSEMMQGKRPVLFSRAKRDPFGGFCKGCFPLACPMGPPGPPGSPGPDGRPGESGNQGFAGEDGFDVQLESEPEMPCVVCPAGPPGPRGSQGERGRQGQSGQKGDAGPDGNPGIDGPLGLGGLPGNIGPRGPDGPQGLEGKTAVAGIGIKGPKGPPGPMGMMGPPGPQGRNSNLPGETGKPGPAGPMGPQGGPGMEGNEGPYGPPGEPGMPASYCPSDCGVQQILANIMPEKMAVHKLGEGYQGYESAQSAPSNTNSGSYARLRDDPAFQAKLKRKMARKHRLRQLKIRRL